VASKAIDQSDRRHAPIDPSTRIGHVHLKVADLDRALHYYCDVLGFTETQRFDRQTALISAGGYHHLIGLNTRDSEGGLPPPKGTTGLYHVAILYPNRAALADALRRLTLANMPIDRIVDHGIGEAFTYTIPTATRSSSAGTAPRKLGRAPPMVRSRLFAPARSGGAAARRRRSAVIIC
jgi:catechol-2,3-dioxygenase